MTTTFLLLCMQLALLGVLLPEDGGLPPKRLAEGTVFVCVQIVGFVKE
jgi:hypothetical protein